MYDDADLPLLDTTSSHTDSRTSTCHEQKARTQTFADPVTTSSTLGPCAGCGTRITDRYFLFVADQPWHSTCLRCTDCHVQLDTHVTCFVKERRVFCKQDYQRRFAQRRCARCHVGLTSLELVMRSRDFFYHVDCFTCFSCNKLLSPGATYGVYGNQVFCREDYELLVNNSQLDTRYCHVYNYGYSDVEAQHEMTDYSGHGLETISLQKGRSRKRRHLLSVDGCFQTLGLIPNKHGDLIPRDKYGGQPHRQKRVRTSFKHTQLRTMKSYFAVNHNPDAKDLKELAKKTQLSKRVLQVWFQNARAKYRRSSTGKTGSDNTELTQTDTNKTADDAEQLLDLSKCRSPTLSDVSTNPSMTSMDMIECSSKLSDSFHDGFSDDNISS